MTKNIEISRRDFVKLAIAGVGTGVFGVLFGHLAKSKGIESFEDSDYKVILSELFKKTGVEVPSEPSDLYSFHKYTVDSSNNKLVETEKIPNLVPDKEMALTIYNSIINIPGAGNVFQLLVPHTVKQNVVDYQAVPTANYLGKMWPATLNKPSVVEYAGDDLPKDRFLSNKSMVQLVVPEGLKMTDVIDLSSNEDVLNIPYLAAVLLSSLSELPKNIRTFEYSSKMTVGERIQTIVAHESGHGFLDKVRHYNAEGDMEKYWSSSSRIKFGGYRLDVETPLLKIFADINGWEVIPLREALMRVDEALAEKLLGSDSGADVLVWDRKPSEWGNCQNREIRISPYASWAFDIEEVFSEFLMASIYFPELLSKTEKTFFDMIHAYIESSTSEMNKMVNEIANSYPKYSQGKIDKRFVEQKLA